MHKKKCPNCNGCMSILYIFPHRFYYCAFCTTWYGGQDASLFIVPRDLIYKMQKGDMESYDKFRMEVKI